MSTQTPDLRTAAQAVIDRWETPLWKDAPATAGYIAALRDALAADHTEHPLGKVGRWYMVNRDGMATLCVDRADAEKEAADAQRFWPHMGPHRAVQLVEASFEPADMATASADGFRSAAAELAKLRGQRAVLCSLLGECLPVIDALIQMPGTDDSDARLNGLAGRITGALNALAEDQVMGGES